MDSDKQFWISTIAIVIGPIIAVQAQRWLEGLKDRRRRREDVFYKLMATRGNKVNPEHVMALNRIDVEWYGTRTFGIHHRSRIEEEVIAAWKLYLDHLNTPAGAEVWLARAEELFVDLLYVMSKSLGYDFDKVALKRGAYTPTAHGQWEQEWTKVRKGLADWLDGAKAVQIAVAPKPDGEQTARTN